MEPSPGGPCAVLGKTCAVELVDPAFAGQRIVAPNEGAEGYTDLRTVNYDAITHRVTCPRWQMQNCFPFQLKQQTGPLPLIFGRGCLLGLLSFLTLP